MLLATRARPARGARSLLTVGVGAMAMLAVVAVVWAVMPSGTPDLSGSPAEIGRITPHLDGGEIAAPASALPTRAIATERSNLAELARVATHPAVSGLLLAALVLGVVAGSLGLIGGRPGWASTLRGRAPPLVVTFPPVR